ncbi:hypothetical protein OOK31_35280 [Streptomyces sp. NBC_00249]|uniref:hypothetical protein n=1 Tax=Streptomyces sp. NBC_00249 TaxID=2975690 RepID=UPI0022510E68|nr:hypothetical protein [Streptomyces sp. NBC_00249]MCX5199090.1 hypothetical protein [Streptomyces sp. NBC_00249]
MTTEEEPSGRPDGRVRWKQTVLPIGLGGIAMLIGVFLLLVPVRSADAAARAFAAAQPCAPGLTPRQQAQCLSSVPATVERVRTTGRRAQVTHIDAARGDGTKQHLDMQWTGIEQLVAQGEQVRLVSWRGEVRSIAHGARFSRSTFTDRNPYTAYAVPFAWGAGLLLGGPVMVWIGCWQRWLSGRYRRAAPWQFMVPAVAGALVAVHVPVTAVALNLRIEEALRWSGIGAALIVLVAGAVSLYKALRGEPDTIEVAPRRDDKQRVFGALLLGDRSGPGGTHAHSRLVVGPGVLAFTDDPAGAFRRKPLPAALVLERVRPLFASDPDQTAASELGIGCLVAQCRDGERELLIAVRRKDMPWLVGALAPAEPVDAV